MSIRIGRFKLNLNISQIIAFSFLGIILVGAVLLTLPIASTSGKSVGFLTGLFTATSSVCVTGLTVVEVWSTFNFFGQFVILILMEAGGLGFMSIISLLLYVVNHKSNIQSMSIMAESIGADGIKNIARIQKRLVFGALLFEGIGAVILFLEFLPQSGVTTSIWLGIFHSVSAFCNAGFDIMGLSAPGASMATLQTQPIALITIALLIVIGGIGFIVWDDIVSAKHPRRWTINTRLVLQITGILLVIGTVLYFIFEHNNPNTIGNLSLVDKISNSFFQSVTPRTAGFAALDQAALTDASSALTILLMYIGGSAGSTAGGIKTVTFAIVIMSILSNATGRRTVIMKKRTISNEQRTHAFTIFGSYLLLTILGGFILTLTSGVEFHVAFYESVSALATVGLSFGITPTLSVISKIILIVLMYIGRVGLLTITVGFFKKHENASIKYPSVKVMIG